MNKKVLSFMLAVIMAAGVCLTGCGGKEQEQSKAENQGKEEQQKSDDSQGAETAGNEEIDIWAPFEETVTVTSVKSDYSYISYPEGDDIDNNLWTRTYLDRFNIKVENEWVSDDYDTKLNLQIAEGNIPDFVRVNATQLEQLVEADMLYDLTELYDTYASEDIKSFMEYDEPSFRSGFFDDKLYGVAQLHYGVEAQYDFVWIRQDWLAECGLEAPETVEDLETIAKTFMDKYGAYGIAAEKSLEYLNLLAPGWGAHPGMWVRDDSGNIAYGSTTEEYKNALADWAKWYKEGIIHSNFITMDMAKANEDVISGKVGIMPYYLWWGAVIGTDYVTANGFDAIYRPYKLPSATGEPVSQSIYCGNATYVAVSKKCEHPEAVFKMINFYQYIQSAEAEEKEPELRESLTAGSLVDTQANARVANPTIQMNETTSIYNAVITGDTSNLTPNFLVSYNNVKAFIENPNEHPEYTHGYCMYGFEGSTTTWVNEYIEKGQYLENVLWAFTPNILIESGATLDTILLEGFTKIIVGDEPIEYFDTVVEKWKAAGGEKAIQEMEELYN